MTALLHALEHASALLGLIVLVLLAWGYTRYRRVRMTPQQRADVARHLRESRVGWHPDDHDGPQGKDRHVH